METESLQRRAWPLPRTGSRGSATLFFVAVLLPIFLIFFVLFLDVGSYYREQQRAQLALDEAAVHAAHFLPHVANTQRAAEEYLVRYGSLTANAMVEVTADGVILRLEHLTPLTFAQFFLPGIGIPFTAFSAARVSPVDAYIAMDVSQRVVPQNEAMTDDFMEGLPAATFFAYDNPVIVNGATRDARFLTAQCFNTLFSSVKRAAASIQSLLAAFRLNAVGVGVFPSQFGLGDLRAMRMVEDLILSGEAEGIFPAYARIDAQSNWCAAAASSERVSHDAFSFPTGLVGIPQHSRPAPAEDTIVDRATFEFNPAYGPYLRASEAIWSVAGRPELPQTDLVLRELASKFGAPPSVYRGGLRNRADGVAVVIAGDLPWVHVRQRNALGAEVLVPQRFGESEEVAHALAASLQTFRSVAKSNPQRRIQLFYVLIAHASYRHAIDEHGGALRRVFEDGVRDPLSGESISNLSLKVLIVGAPEQAIREVSSALVLAGRHAVLAR